MTPSRVCIAQPEHLPWLGYFDKIRHVDTFVFLDTVQFKKRYFENRNRIRTQDGWIWLTVPVRSAGRFHQAIGEVEIDTGRASWQEDHWKTLALHYRKAAHFERYHKYLADTYLGRSWSRLADLNIHLIRWGAAALGLHPRFLLASELGVEGHRSELLAAICKHLDATCYLSGVSGKEYLDERIFSQHQIAVEYQDFRHPAYQQLHTPFAPCMAFLDLLFNYGPQSREILLEAPLGRLETVFT